MSFGIAQTTTKQVSSATSTTMAMTNNTVSGNCLIVAVVTSQSTLNSSTVTDTLGNVYVRDASVLGGTTFSPDVEVWRAQGIIGGATTINVSVSGGNFDIGIIAREYTDIAHSNPLDVKATGTGTSGGTITATTAVDKYTTELVIAIGGQAATGVTWSAGAGMGNLTQLGTIGVSASAAMEDEVVSTNGTQTAAFGGTASANWGHLVVVYNSRQAFMGSISRPYPFSPGLAR